MVRLININKKGFTVLELLISISVFSVAMMAVMSAVMIMGRQYQKASYTTQLNSASRSLHQALATDINYGAVVPAVLPLSPPAGDYNSYICLDKNVIYAWPSSSDAAVIRYGLYKHTYTDCNATSAEAAVTNGTNILPQNGFVASMTIDGANFVTVKTDFRTGTADMFSDSSNPKAATTTCLPVLKGGDFCSIVQYNSTVKKRI